MRNQDGLDIIDFCVANKLAIPNTFFCKNKSKLITFSSWGSHTKIDFILVRRVQLKNIKDTKVISSEECITQHSYLSLICLYQQNLSNPFVFHQEGKLGNRKMLLFKRNLNRQFQWNVDSFLQKCRALGNLWKMDYLKLQMRYVDGHEVGVHSTKKLCGGIMMWTMQ